MVYVPTALTRRALFLGIDRRLTVTESVNDKWCLLLTRHTRRADRHTRQRDPGNGGGFTQHAFNHVDRYEAIHDVPVNHHEMATFQLRRHTVLVLYLRKPIGIDILDVKAILVQIGGVAVAALAIRVFIKRRR